MAPTKNIGSGNLDDLLDQVWYSQASWSTDTIYVYFPQTLPTYWSNLGFSSSQFTAFDVFHRADFMNAIRMWADLIDVDVYQTGFNSLANVRGFGLQFQFGGSPTDTPYSNGGKVGSSPGWPNLDDVVDVQITRTNGGVPNFDFSKSGFSLILHEIGHTWGLRHPGMYDASDSSKPTYDDDAEYIQDSKQYTVMSYFSEANTGADFTGTDSSKNQIDGPMLHDVYAIQNIYGADTSIRSTNTRYGYNASGIGNTERAINTYDFDNNTRPIFCIWDPGGNDTLDLSGDTANDVLDLREGHFSSTHGMSKNLSIAFNPDPALYPNLDNLIENAVGGSGNDKIIGNDLDNRLYGQSGNDSLFGLKGADTLYGGNGNDLLAGYFGLDRYYGGGGNDTVNVAYSNQKWLVDLDPDTGSAYANNLGGGTEFLSQIEGFWTGSGADTIYGSDADNHLDGNGGNDRLYGYAGDDTLEGGGGNDKLYRGDGSNLIDGGGGNDTADYGQTSFGVKVNLHNQFSSQVVVTRPNPANNQVDLIKHIEVFLATVYDDTITGSYAIANTIDGRAGDDEIYGNGAASGGYNDLFGGFGSDTLFSGAHNDSMHGGSGYDYASYDTGTYTGGVSVDLSITVGQAIAGFGSDILTSIEGLYGTDHNDSLFGNSGANIIYGLDGNDRLVGRNGNDELWGGFGNNTLDGGAGNDSLHGGNQNDLFDPGPGDDYIVGIGGADQVDYSGSSDGVRVDLAVSGPQLISASQGHDNIVGVEYVSGSAQNDTLRGDDKSNKLYGITGNDLLEARGGNDIYDGGMGSDTASFESASVGVTVDLANTGPQNTQDGIDSFISIENLRGSAYDDFLAGDLIGNRIEGGAGNDLLLGRAGNDTIYGDGGDDLMLGGPGDDVLNGRTGINTVSYFFAAAGVNVDLTIVGAQNTGGDGIDSLYFIRNLDGSTHNDTLYGNHVNNALKGGEGNDTLVGRAGNDTLFGGPGGDRLDGGDGNDWVSFQLAAAGVSANLLLNVIAAGDASGDVYVSIENLIGSLYDDTLIGNLGNNILQGGEGDDSLSSLDGDDRLIGGAGADTLNGSTGIDAASYQDAQAGVLANLGNAAANTGDAAGDVYISIENLFGSDFDDMLIGDGGANYIDARLGNDTVAAGGGDDTLLGQGGNDVLNGGAGADSLVGSIGDDTLLGGSGADMLDGGDGIDLANYATASTGVRADLANPAQNTGDAAGDVFTDIENLRGSAYRDTLKGDAGDNQIEGGDDNDRLVGMQGNDSLIGGIGRDILIGGSGSDHFIYSNINQSLANSQRDHITDFHPGTDLIDLSGIDAEAGVPGDQAFHLIVGAFTGAKGELRITGTPNAFVSGDVNGDGNADFSVRVDNVTGLTEADFIL